MENTSLVKQEQDRTAVAKINFLMIFEKNLGMINITCRKLGIHRSTYYSWIEKDKEFYIQCQRILEMSYDYVEDQLMIAIHEGKSWAIRFYLAHKHPDYMPKK